MTVKYDVTLTPILSPKIKNKKNKNKISLLSLTLTTHLFVIFESWMLWQPLITKTNDYTSSKSLKLDIKWKVHKRTQQRVSA